MSVEAEKRTTQSQPGLRGLLMENPMRFSVIVKPVVTDIGVRLGTTEFKLPVGDFSVYRRAREIPRR